MTFFPSSDLYIVSQLPIDEVRKRLAEEIQPSKFRIRLGYELMEQESFFTGIIENDTFQIKRRDRGRKYTNDPKVSGHIETYDNGTRLYIEMKVLRMLRLAPVVWSLYLAMILVITLTHPLNAGSIFQLLISCAVPTFFYLYSRHSFKVEADSITAFLTLLLEGKVEPLPNVLLS